MKYYCDDMGHLVCVPYSVANLHQMAEDIGIKRCWFHASPYPHYDIPKKMQLTISEKCEKVSPKKILMICKGMPDEPV